MKNRRLLIRVGAIVLIAAAFWLLDFRLGINNNETQKLVMTTDMGDNMPASMQRKDTISLILVGEGPLVEALKESLVKKLAEAGLGQIRLEQGLKPLYPNPVLIVKVVGPGPIWTPLFAKSDFSIHAGYDSGGDTTFMAPIEETHTSIGKPDAANMYAEYDVKDRSLGLISRPGYYRYLADYLAREIVAVLKDLYKLNSITSPAASPTGPIARPYPRTSRSE